MLLLNSGDVIQYREIPHVSNSLASFCQSLFQAYVKIQLFHLSKMFAPNKKINFNMCVKDCMFFCPSIAMYHFFLGQLPAIQGCA